MNFMNHVLTFFILVSLVVTTTALFQACAKKPVVQTPVEQVQKVPEDVPAPQPETHEDDSYSSKDSMQPEPTPRPEPSPVKRAPWASKSRPGS